MIEKIKIDTDIGSITIFYIEDTEGIELRRIVLPYQNEPDQSEESFRYSLMIRSDLIKLIEGIRQYLMGKKISFEIDIESLKGFTPFQRGVLKICHEIPWGELRSYGDIAREMGRPKAYRAVGNTLSINPFPIIIPCHRVIRSDGGIGGFQGSVYLKRRLLEIEGLGDRIRYI